MKSIIKISAFLLFGAIIATSCKKSDSTTPAATVYYDQQDQVGRPAINTVFNASADKDMFNVTAPVNEGAIFQPKFLTTLVGLDGAIHAGNPAYVQFTTNALGWTPAVLTTALSTDVLTVSTTGPTTFATLSGRTLADDVIDIELKYVLFGGPTGNSNPGYTSDHVDANDKAFSASFPYEASPF